MTVPLHLAYLDHTPSDTPDKIDYERTARVVAGLEPMLADLAGAD